MNIAIQFVGALAILVPFALLQLRRTTTESWLYLWLNFIGAAILAWSAWVGAQWGFVPYWKVCGVLHHWSALSAA